ncbi:MAG: right-handed parallel beta-helix repeat-containing protein [Phycisphaerales bacterium]
MNTARTSFRRFAPVTAAALLVVAGTLFAGPLNPPTGPVTSTMKTMTEVEPRIAINATNTPGDNDASPSMFKITQPGSYYLTENVAVGAGLDGIEIASANVTIDLNGFTLYGLASSQDGVTTNDAFRVGLTIRNGVIRTFGGMGLDLGIAPAAIGTAPQGILLENLHVIDNNGSAGSANDGIAKSCIFNGNLSGFSFTEPFASTIESCTANDNDQRGISIAMGMFTNCTASGNGGYGIVGGTAVNCVAERNGTYGIFSDVVTNCTVRDNGTDNIRVNISAMGNTVVRSATNGAGTVGIAINADRVRVENNTITGFPTAIRSIFANGLIVSNKFSWCNTAINVAGGNRVGTITTAFSIAPVNGNSGGGLGTNDVYDNILY